MFIFTNPRTANPVCVELLGHQPEERHIHYPIDERRVVPAPAAVLTKHCDENHSWRRISIISSTFWQGVGAYLASMRWM